MRHVVGVDDAPFKRNHRDDVLVVGAVFSGARLATHQAGLTVVPRKPCSRGIHGQLNGEGFNLVRRARRPDLQVRHDCRSALHGRRLTDP